MAAVCKWLLAFALLWVCQVATGQSGPLDKTVNLHVNGQTLQQTLTLLADKGNFSFAYNSDLIPVDSLISYTANKPAKEILNDLVGRYVTYTIVGSHVVLTAKAPPPKPVKTSFAVSGQVLNAKTGEALADVSVYSGVKLKYDITDNSGTYDLSLAQREPVQTLHISKIGYQDTALVVSISEIYNLNVQLQPLELYRDTVKTIEKLRFVKFFTSMKQRVNAVNINDPLRRFGQVSFLPILGTNFRMSGAITNMLSLNVVGGYNGGVDGLEIGGAFNIIHKHVQGVQIAGLGNTAGGHVLGVQLGGFYNLNMGSLSGFQGAGFVNVQWQSSKGFQAAGALNIQRHKFTGFQASGGINYTDTLWGIQATGGINIVRQETQGIQIAPVNYSRYVKGIQIGVINIADSITGIPIGLLSFVRKGYLHADVYADELTHINASLRTGVRYFHNIVTAGISWTGGDPLWRLGYGLGTELRFGPKKRGFSNVDITVSYINRGSNFVSDLNLLTTLNWDIGFRVHKHFGIFIGPTIKVYSTSYVDPLTGEPQINLNNPSVYSNLVDGYLHEIWIGARGGFRF